MSIIDYLNILKSSYDKKSKYKALFYTILGDELNKHGCYNLHDVATSGKKKDRKTDYKKKSSKHCYNLHLSTRSFPINTYPNGKFSIKLG